MLTSVLTHGVFIKYWQSATQNTFVFFEWLYCLFVQFQLPPNTVLEAVLKKVTQVSTVLFWYLSVMAVNFRYVAVICFFEELLKDDPLLKLCIFFSSMSDHNSILHVPLLSFMQYYVILDRNISSVWSYIMSKRFYELHHDMSSNEQAHCRPRYRNQIIDGSFIKILRHL